MAERRADIIPDIRLADVLQQRHSGLGSPAFVIRLGVAVTVSWLIAKGVSQSSLGIFAPITTLLVVQSSPWSTLGLSIQRILGTGIGVLVASIWVNTVGLSWWSFLIAVLVALLIARMLPWAIVGQVQIPVAVVFVLAIGPGSMQQDLWRVIDVVIGGIVGILAVIVYPPRPRPEILERAMSDYRDAMLGELERVAAESGTAEATLPDGVNHGYVTSSRALRGEADVARQALIKLAETVHWNPRGRAVREQLPDDDRRLRRLGGIAIQIRGVAGAANLVYDRGHEAALAPEQLRRVVTAVVALARAALGPPGSDVRAGDPVTVEALAKDVHALIRTTADGIVGDGAVGRALGSLSILGRLDHIRRQLVIFATWLDVDDDVEDAEDG